MATVQASTRSNASSPAAGRRRAIPLSEPSLTGREGVYLQECLQTRWVSSAGPFVQRFETAIAAAVGTAHAVAVVNGTAALHVALLVAGVEPDDEVLVSDLTFVAPVNAIRYCGAHPVLVDAEIRSWQFDVEKAARFLAQACELRGAVCYNRRTGRRVRAMLPVHILGLACPMDQIMTLARRYHLRVVEDAAEAMGVRYRGRHVGTFGDLGVLSFNGNKIITAGGGGAVLTDHAPSAARVRYLATQAKDDELEYRHDAVGYNYRLTNLQAAVGLAQLEQLERFLEQKRSHARTYAQRLQRVSGLGLMPTPEQTDAAFWLYTVLLPEGTTRQQRTAVLRRLRAFGVEARPLWQPIHGLAPYRSCQALDPVCAVQLYERAISLPSSVGLSHEELEWCVSALAEAIS